jgi:hypothetical protein
MTNDLGLDECIRIYERENIRKQSLESKASYSLGVVAIFVGIWGNIIKDIINIHSISFLSLIIICLNILIVILIGSCAFYCLNVLKIRKYAFPIEDNKPNNLMKQLSKSENELKNELFDSYISSYFINNLKNNKKAQYLYESSKLLLYSIIFSVITLIILVIGNGVN